MIIRLKRMSISSTDMLEISTQSSIFIEQENYIFKVPIKLAVQYFTWISVEGSCPLAFCEDLEYWQIDEAHFETCCRKAYYNMKNVITDKMAGTCADIKTEDVNTVSGNKVVRFQRQLWDLMENPEANLIAKMGKLN